VKRDLHPGVSGKADHCSQASEQRMCYWHATVRVSGGHALFRSQDARERLREEWSMITSAPSWVIPTNLERSLAEAPGVICTGVSIETAESTTAVLTKDVRGATCNGRQQSPGRS